MFEAYEVSNQNGPDDCESLFIYLRFYSHVKHNSSLTRSNFAERITLPVPVTEVAPLQLSLRGFGTGQTDNGTDSSFAFPVEGVSLTLDHAVKNMN